MIFYLKCEESKTDKAWIISADSEYSWDLLKLRKKLLERTPITLHKFRYEGVEVIYTNLDVATTGWCLDVFTNADLTVKITEIFYEDFLLEML